MQRWETINLMHPKVDCPVFWLGFTSNYYVRLLLLLNTYAETMSVGTDY